ncbi:MAG: glycogen debranching enzyme N-terminal domain-containing protein, partial [Conexivisphaerales archaeon]
MNYNEEWILSNMNGSYSSSSASFANLRTYHGLCVKRSGENYERVVVLSKLFEEFTVNGKKFNLDTNYYRGVIYPEGYKLLEGYELYPIPAFHFKLEGVSVVKSIVMDPQNDWLVIRYEINGDLPSSIFLHPLLAFRNYHRA